MKETGLMFKAPLVRSILDGTKTQTRRVVKLPHANPLGEWEALQLGGPDGGRTSAGKTIPAQMGIGHTRTGEILTSPYGGPGDRLWVRETFAKVIGQSGGWIETDYFATYTHGDRLGDTLGIKKRWTPSIHMPRDASRLTLDITGVRLERLQDISRGDAMAEGCPFQNMADGPDPRKWFSELWTSTGGDWAANPWVWVIDFKRDTAQKEQP